MRFLHTGDWQLGMTRRYLSAEAQARFTDARLDAVRTIGHVAAERGCAFIVVAGDVFESNQVDRRLTLRALEAMAACPVPVYLLPGNHDPLDAASVYLSSTFRANCPAHVIILDSSTPVEAAPGVELVGAPWPTKRPLHDLVEAACTGLPEPAGTLRVLVGHGAVDDGAPDPDDPSLIDLGALEAAVDRGCVHYCALGDRHSLTEVGTTGRVRYAGSPEPTDFNEVAPGHVLVVDLHSGGCAVEAMSVGSWRFVRAHRDLDGAGALDELEAWLAAQPDKHRTVLRLSFAGTLALREAARLNLLMAHAADVYAAAEQWQPDMDLVVLPDGQDWQELDLGGYALGTADQLRRAVATPGPGAETARGALALLYRLRTGGQT